MRRAPSYALFLIYLKIAHTLIGALIKILSLWDTNLSACLPEGVQHFPGEPLILDAPFTSRSVQIALTPGEILRLPKHG